jgi:hypothetical protein
MVGTFQAAVVLGLSLFFPPAQVGTHGNAYANVLWLAQVAQQTVFGLVFLFSSHIQIGRVFQASREVEDGLEAEEAEYAAEGADPGGAANGGESTRR